MMGTNFTVQNVDDLREFVLKITGDTLVIVSKPDMTEELKQVWLNNCFAAVDGFASAMVDDAN